MSGVEFQEENIPRTPRSTRSSPGITDYVIKFGLAKDRTQASNRLLLFVVVAVALAFFLFVSSNRTAVDNIKIDQTDPVFQDATL